jgi:hypothetical protein
LKVAENRNSDHYEYFPPQAQTGYELQAGLPTGEKRETLEDIKRLERETNA